MGQLSAQRENQDHSGDGSNTKGTGEARHSALSQDELELAVLAGAVAWGKAYRRYDALWGSIRLNCSADRARRLQGKLEEMAKNERVSRHHLLGLLKSLAGTQDE